MVKVILIKDDVNGNPFASFKRKFTCKAYFIWIPIVWN